MTYNICHDKLMNAVLKNTPFSKMAVRSWKLRSGFHQILKFWREVDVRYEMDMIAFGMSYDILFADLNENQPMPNDNGLFLMAMWNILVIMPLTIIHQSLCDHPNFIDESYGGPDSGCEAGHCPDCGWSFHVTMY